MKEDFINLAGSIKMNLEKRLRGEHSRDYIYVAITRLVNEVENGTFSSPKTM